MITFIGLLVSFMMMHHSFKEENPEKFILRMFSVVLLGLTMIRMIYV